MISKVALLRRAYESRRTFHPPPPPPPPIPTSSPTPSIIQKFNNFYLAHFTWFIFLYSTYILVYFGVCINLKKTISNHFLTLAVSSAYCEHIFSVFCMAEKETVQIFNHSLSIIVIHYWFFSIRWAMVKLRLDYGLFWSK